MISIKIVTYCTWTSIGSILQALGLKTALNNIGCKSSIYMDRRENEYGHVKIRSLKSIAVRTFETLISKKRKASFQKRMKFISENINIEYFNDYDELIRMVEKDEDGCFLAGSDQIWNPDICSPAFFLDFAKGKKRVSYAASMGKTQIAPQMEDVFSRMIGNFDMISVREEECADVICRYTDKEISVNIDPTFLMSATEWREYEEEYGGINQPYILLYMLYWNDECTDKVRELKRKTGLPVYAITNGLTKAYADKYFYDVGVGNFLWLIDNAKYVITSSFHGVALSTILNKKFSAVVNPASPSRINNLLRILSVPHIDIADLDGDVSFDYDRINAAIESQRDISMQYLKKAIE